jgi:hypothetical protein
VTQIVPKVTFTLAQFSGRLIGLLIAVYNLMATGLAVAQGKFTGTWTVG